MLRLRVAAFSLAAGLVLTSGCASVSSWFSRSRICCPEGDTSCMPCCDGSMMDDQGPMMCPTDGSGPGCGTTVPPLAPPPRLVPQPNATRQPYYPTKGTVQRLGKIEKIVD